MTKPQCTRAGVPEKRGSPDPFSSYPPFLIIIVVFIQHKPLLHFPLSFSLFLKSKLEPTQGLWWRKTSPLLQTNVSNVATPKVPLKPWGPPQLLFSFLRQKVREGEVRLGSLLQCSVFTQPLVQYDTAHAASVFSRQVGKGAPPWQLCTLRRGTSEDLPYEKSTRWKTI